MTMATESPSFSAVQQTKRASEQDLAARPNAVAVGIGYKISGGQSTGELAVIVSVKRKLPTAQLSSAEMVPKTLNGVKTDVVETGEIVAFQNPRGKLRPARPGISIGHLQVTAGTFGCLVRKNGLPFILSNNHVLANSNNARVGDPVWQPGQADGGTSADQIGTLEAFIPMAFDGQTPPPTPPPPGNGCSPLASILSMFGSAPAPAALAVAQNTPGNNKVDCALARPMSASDVTPDILNIGVPAGVRGAELGMQLQKSGRTTGYTTGSIQQVDVTVTVNYGGPTATFTGQLLAGAMSQGGDSGSAVLDMQRNVVGLLFAGSSNTTIMNPIQLVLEALGVELVTA
jgi:hypothetical protein